MPAAKRILVVSADNALYSRLVNHLSSDKYSATAIDRIDVDLETEIVRNPPDIFIIDPQISRLNGVDISLRIRQISPAPILILTTARTIENQIRVLDLAAEDYLSEPFDVEEITGRIERILAADENVSSR